jgi:DNA-binding transcriptional regulator YdaS (Cro superfamily)
MLSMKKETAIVFAGNANRLAKLLGINRSAISQWGEDVPQKRVLQLKNLKPEWFETFVLPN